MKLCVVMCGGVKLRFSLTPTLIARLSLFSDSSRVRGDSPSVDDNDASVVDDDDDGDENASEEEEVQTGGGSASSSRQPSNDAVAKWTNVLDLSKEPVKTMFGPNATKLAKRWGGGDAAAPFRAPRPDPCLLQAFGKAKQANKSLVESSSSIASSSGAAAHAILSASETIESCIAEFQRIASTQEGDWKTFFNEAATCLKDKALAPLSDAVTLQASAFGRSIATVRNGVVAAAEAPVKEVLKSVPPSGGFFFGDPADRLTSTMNYALISAQLQQASSASRGKRGGSSASSYSRSKATTMTTTTTPTTSAARKTSSTRPFPRVKSSKRGK